MVLTASVNGVGPFAFYAAFLISSSFWSRPVAEWLRAQGLLRGSLMVAATLLVIGLIRQGRPHRALSARLWTRTALVAAAYVGVGRYAAMAPEEWAHFLHMAILVYLGMRCWPWPQAGAAALAVGALEETVQLWAPGRVFAWRDIGLNAAGVLLALAVWYSHRDSRR